MGSPYLTALFAGDVGRLIPNMPPEGIKPFLSTHHPETYIEKTP
jgi:hypothetical protein